MEINTISPSFGKGYFFSDNSNLTNLVDIGMSSINKVSMKTKNELYLFLTRLKFCLEKRSCYSTRLY